MNKEFLQKWSQKINRLTELLDQKAGSILLFIIIGYILLFSVACVLKYQHFQYNALDLAILNQVFYNTSSGNLFGFTIHPHSYLGDHLELIILFLAPFYLILKSPVVLLILQTIFIGLSALPIFLVTKRILAPRFALLLGFVFLANPFVQNMNLFEFHILPFALVFIFFAFYFFQTKKFFPFLIFFIFSLLVREDVALFLIMFSVLSWLKKRPLKWIITPFILSAFWFIAALKLFPYLNHYQSYKFLYYYSWMGDSVREMIFFIINHPLNVMGHIFTVHHIFLVLALFSIFIFIPLARLKYLLFGFLPLLQILLASFAGGDLVLQTHYSTLLVASAFIALIYSLEFLLQQQKEIKCFSWQGKMKKFTQENLPFIIITLIIITLYGTITFGPLTGFFNYSSLNQSAKELINSKQHYLAQVAPTEKVVATYEFLAPLSSREKIYSLHYVFLGKKQYSSEEYQLPEVDSMLIDFSDFITYQVQFSGSAIYDNAFITGDDRMRDLIKERNLKVTQITDTFAYLKKDDHRGIDLYTISQDPPEIKNKTKTKVSPEIEFSGWNPIGDNPNNHPNYEKNYQLVPLSLVFFTNQTPVKDYQLILSKNGYEKIYPLAYGLYPTSDWQQNKWVTINYWFLVPNDAFSGRSLGLKFVRLSDQKKPYLGLDKIRSAEFKNVIWEKVGGEISIPL